MTPFFCRMIANLSKYFKDIGEALVAKLLDDFDHLKENTKDSFKDKERRIRNIKFICELTKFRVFPTINALNCLKEYYYFLKKLQEILGLLMTLQAKTSKW